MRPEDLQTPTLLVDLDVVAHNLATMRHYLDDRMDRWRPHVKTTKIPEVLAMVLDAGVRRFKVATTREAEVLLRCAGRRQIDLLFAMAMRGTNCSGPRNWLARTRATSSRCSAKIRCIATNYGSWVSTSWSTSTPATIARARR